MFTLKFYTDDGRRSVIHSAESMTILRDEGGPASGMAHAEITLHRSGTLQDIRIDVGPSEPRLEGWPPLFQKVIIENSAGKTIEIIHSYGISWSMSPAPLQAA